MCGCVFVGLHIDQLQEEWDYKNQPPCLLRPNYTDTNGMQRIKMEERIAKVKQNRAVTVFIVKKTIFEISMNYIPFYESIEHTRSQ